MSASIAHSGTDGSGRFCTTNEIQDLVAAFEATTLPYRQWTHAAHLTVGLWYLIWFGPAEALDRLRTGLQRYNAAHASEPIRVGYHETITRFWLWTVRQYLRRTPCDGTIADLANGLIASCADRELPFAYYSRDRLMSEVARHEWVEPDLRELVTTGHRAGAAHVSPSLPHLISPSE